MKRRSFLAMLGLAPVAAVPAVAATPSQSYVRVPISKLNPNTILEFTDGVVRMNVAKIGEINSGTIRKSDGSFAMDIGAGSVSLSS